MWEMLLSVMMGGMAQNASTARVEDVFDKFAPSYDRQMGFFERLMFRGVRAWAVSQAAGTVVEIAVGTGLNLPLYGSGVQRVIGVDVSEGMLAIARKRVAELGLDSVELHRGDVHALDLPADSADTVVSTFTVCSIPDPLAAVREAHRVLRPGGRFVLAEHGDSTRAVGRAVLRVLEPLSVRFSADHLTRDPVSYLTAAGFDVEEVRRSGPGGTAFLVLARKNGI